MVSEKSNGQYELKMEELGVSVWGRTFSMENIHLHPTDTSSTAPKIDLEEFSVTGIRYLPYLFNGKIDVGGIQLRGPHVNFVQDSPDSLTFLKSSDSTTSGDSQPPVIEAEQFEIVNASADYWKVDQSETRGEIHDFNFRLSDIRVDSASLAQAPYFNFEDIQTTSGEIQYELNSGFYTIKTSGIDISTSEGSGTVDSLQLIPEYPRYDFYQAVGYQTDRIDLTIEELLLENPDMKKLKQGEFELEKLSIDGAILDVFRSKALPRPHHNPKKMAHVAFKELKYSITVDTISVNQANISYTEHKPGVPEAGTVTFANLNGTFTDVTNDSAAISQGHNVYLDVTTEVMNEAELRAHFVFPMDKNGSHTAQGSLGSMDVEKLNPILEPVAKIRAASGLIHSLEFEMDLGPQTSDGWVQLAYSDLRIEVLDAENVEEGGSQFFKTFLANIWKVKNHNNEEPLRRGDVSFERVEYKAIFNYWWKSLSSGLKKNIGM